MFIHLLIKRIFEKSLSFFLFNELKNGVYLLRFYFIKKIGSCGSF